MSYAILSPSRQYHTGDWLDDAPLWSPNLLDAYAFLTRDEALETMRRHVALDNEAERTPGFAGCRVASIEDERTRLAMKELRAQGHRASFNDGCTAIWIDFDDRKVSIAKALASFPRNVYGLPVFLRANGKSIKWDHKSA